MPTTTAPADVALWARVANNAGSAGADTRTVTV
jgi:hypothetical protein